MDPLSDDIKPLVFESCHSLWLFDTEQHRYCRVLRASHAGSVPPASQWEPYSRLEVEEASERFVASLNAEGTRQIQSWRHIGPCEACDQNATRELSIEEIHRALLSAPDPSGERRSLPSSPDRARSARHRER
jgi:hypothetical protein